MHNRSIIILDFGGQYAHLIASRVRRFGVYSEILPAETPLADLKHAAGIILSGGPQSVYDDNSPQADAGIFTLGIPVLGICYGMQWMARALGGEVTEGKTKEYGKTEIRIQNNGGGVIEIGDWGLGQESQSPISNLQSLRVWMSHGDEVTGLPAGFIQIATSQACANSAMADLERNFYAFQFHPEVTHSEGGFDMLKRFVKLCHADPWDMKSYAQKIEEEIIQAVGDRHVFLLVSGGVDSSVAFVLLNKILGPERVQGLLVDHGLMRKNETALVQKAFDEFGFTNLRIEDASEEFFAKLAGVTDPEEKRMIIGYTFLDVQKRVSEEMGLTADKGWMLGQGTIYPDTIETGSTKHAAKIKTHHNVIPVIQEMHAKGLVIEPLRDLYKDEVRQLGEEIGLPHDLVWRHPFPGPGLGVRILCSGPSDERPVVSGQQGNLATTHFPLATILPVKSVGVQGDGRTYRSALALFSEHPCNVPDAHWEASTRIPNSDPSISRVLQCVSHADVQELTVVEGYATRDRADLLREADAIVDAEMRSAGLYQEIWQFPVVLLPCGVHGGNSIVLRPINSTDAMTANASHLPVEVLQKMTERIMALQGIDAVFYDLTSKPPGTIEWE